MESSLTFAVSHKVSKNRTNGGPSPLFQVLFPMQILLPGHRTPPPFSVAVPRCPAHEHGTLSEEWLGPNRGGNASIPQQTPLTPHQESARPAKGVSRTQTLLQIESASTTPFCCRGRTSPPHGMQVSTPQSPLSYCALAHSSCTPHR